MWLPPIRTSCIGAEPGNECTKEIAGNSKRRASSELNVATAVKRGVYTVHENLVIKVIGKLADVDAEQLEQALRGWLGLYFKLTSRIFPSLMNRHGKD